MSKHCLHIIWLLVLAGCVADDPFSLVDADACGSPIAFDAELADAASASRGVVTDVDNLNMFAVSATVSTSSADSVYFAHEVYQFDKVGDQVFKSLSGVTHYWLGSDLSYDFFAYSPSPFISFADGVVDKFDFVVSDEVADQADIVVCAALNASYGKSVPLRFSHPLSRISVSQGKQMAAGTIESVSFSGILGKGAYDMRKGEWSTFAADTMSFSFACDVPSAPSSSITGSEYNFFFIPQSLGKDAQMHVAFVDSLGVKHNYVRDLSGAWASGGSYNYSLSISPQLEFVLTDSIVDAFYSIVKVKVNAPDVLPDMEWQVNVAASDGADVSVQWQESVNSFAKMGFWTDNYIVNGVTTQSARGSASTETVSGSGSDYVYVFVPENTGSTDRKITISAVSDSGVLASAVITQKCPAWTAGVGWSQLDDASLCDFGFSWNRKVAYVMPYSVSDYGLETDFSKSDALSLLNGMIRLADASVFSNIGVYYKYYVDNVGSIWHYYLNLDFSHCNSLAAGSRSSGLANTAYLNEKGGSAATGSFVLMIDRAALASDPGESLFRLPSSAYPQENSVPRASGIDDMSLSALCKVLKMNRFNYSVTQLGVAMLEYPSLASSDLVWYLPAVGQFASLPADALVPVVPDKCWSSTAVEGVSMAYLGSGMAVSRADMARVRACRKAVSVTK